MTLRYCRTRVGPVDSPIWLKFCMHAWLGVPITKLIFFRLPTYFAWKVTAHGHLEPL